MRRTYQVGDRVQDGLGHWYEISRLILTAEGFVVGYWVQALTPVGTPAELRPIGTQVRMWPYEIRR